MRLRDAFAATVNYIASRFMVLPWWQKPLAVTGFLLLVLCTGVHGVWRWVIGGLRSPDLRATLGWALVTCIATVAVLFALFDYWGFL